LRLYRMVGRVVANRNHENGRVESVRVRTRILLVKSDKTIVASYPIQWHHEGEAERTNIQSCSHSSCKMLGNIKVS
jgi:hypothetical protein